jgi:hypothetical protein
MRILFFILTFQASCLFAQLDLSIHAGGGASLIYNSATVNMNHSFYGSPIRSIPKRSYEVGVSGRKYFERTYLETGINYSYISSLHKENTTAHFPPQVFFTEIYIENFREIGYLSIPIVLCRNYGNFSVGAGLQPQFVAHISETKKMWYLDVVSPVPVEPILTERTIKTFDLGIVGQANFEATDRISLNAKLYWGITNINNFQEKGVLYEFFQYEDPVVDRRLKNRQFVITLQYKLFQKKAV